MNGKYYFSWFSIIHSHFSCTFYFLILACFNGVLCISSPNRFSVCVSNCLDPCPKAVLRLTIDLVTWVWQVLDWRYYLYLNHTWLLREPWVLQALGWHCSYNHSHYLSPWHISLLWKSLTLQALDGRHSCILPCWVSQPNLAFVRAPDWTNHLHPYQSLPQERNVQLTLRAWLTLGTGFNFFIWPVLSLMPSRNWDFQIFQKLTSITFGFL